MKTYTFEDFDEYAATIQNANVQVMLQNYRKMFWQLRHFEIGGLHVQFGVEGSGTVAEGCSDDEGLLLFAVAQGVVGESNGNGIDSDAAFVLEPGQEFCISSTMANEWFTVFVPGQMLAEVGYNGNQMKSRVVNYRARHVAELRQQLSSLARTIVVWPEVLDSAAASAAAKDVSSILLKILDVQSETNGKGRPRIARDEIIKRSLDYIEQNIGDTIRVDELATAVSVSERTLRTSFVDWYGITPNRYLQLRQLHESRSILLRSHPDDTTVSAVFTQQGIWEFGRFASRYRKLFGELPSESLKAPRG